MIKQLDRWMVREGESKNGEKVRSRYGVLAGAVGVCCNLILFAAKFAVGTLSGSIAITADAFNNLSDTGSSLVTLLGFHIVGKPADREHPFGHGRAEYVTGMVVAFLILLVGLQLFFDALDKILHPVETDSGLPAILVLAAAILGKLLMGLFYRAVGNRIDSASLKAAMTDSISDVAATSAVLLSVAVNGIFHLNIDGYVGALVAVLVFIAGIKALRDTLNPLLGQAPDPALVEQIKQVVLEHPGILGIHDLIVHNYGPGRMLASLHAEVPAEEDIIKSHDQIDLIERELEEKLHVHAVIHMDPVQVHNERVNKLRRELEQVMEEIDPSLTFHDFRIVEGITHTNLIFDVLVPFRYPMTNCELEEAITQKMKQKEPTYYCVITIDKGYSGEY